MIHSLFLIGINGDIILEKHWKKVINRNICDYFFEALSKCRLPQDVAPVIKCPHHYLFTIYRNRLHYVAVTINEVPPLFVIEFLHRIADTFLDYFGKRGEYAINEEIVRVYEILDEMLDNGFPMVTESNILQDLVKPSNLLRTFVSNFTDKSMNLGSVLPANQLGNIPWRRKNVHYNSNEAYFDLIESIHAIIDPSGSTILCEVTGNVSCLIRLSGMPDLSLHFNNPRIIDDTSFHPSVRYRKWETNSIISFVPPDGRFVLLNYSVKNVNSSCIPFTVRHKIDFPANQLHITLIAKPNFKLIENVSVTMEMPKQVLNLSLCSSLGHYSFNISTKQLVWDVGKIENARSPSLKGSIILQKDQPIPECRIPILLNFYMEQISASGLGIVRLDIHNEKYSTFKGVKSVSKAGHVEFRTQ